MHSTIPFRNFLSMGTRFDLVLPGSTQESADIVFTGIKTELNRLENKLSNYISDSALSVLNSHAVDRPQKTDKEIMEMISELMDLSDKTLGYFDFTMGKRTHSRNNQNKEEVKVKDTEVAVTDSLKVNEKIELDKEKNTVQFLSSDVSVDSDGFGKGKALDEVKTILNSYQVDHAFVSFGNSSILAHGKHPHSDTWKTGIAHLFLPAENVFVFDLKDECISVSGTTPENMEKYGRSHIIDPLTGREINGYFQCAVAGEKGLITEVLSTSLACAPPEKRDQIMQNFDGYRAVIIEYKNEEPTITYKYQT